MILYGTNPIAWSNDDDQTLGAHISLEQCLDQAASIGFDGIEKGHKLPTNASGVEKELGGRGLRYISGWHSLNLLRNSIDDEKAAMQPFLDFLKSVGSDVIITCETSNAIHGTYDRPINDKPNLNENGWQKFGAGVEALAQFAANQGVTLVYHHHMGTIVETPAEIDLFMEHTGPATKLLFDTGHCYFGAGDPAVVLERHISRVAHIHAKNVRADIMVQVREQNLSFLEGVRRGVFTVPGDTSGCIEFEPVLKIAADHNYSGWLVIEAEQDPKIRDPLIYQSMGLKALKEMARQTGLDQTE